ncbi:type VI secretion system membrane subunit TssM [Stigmatella sp. ncwal1]|uniref:Type VI secretion system membrane subunit TssM n=1 Tax=Stigmatella ashevillensis TaxID=2995309 RepID=A0ABT5DBX0_9BACT|nr:type VI secretion system membrane subunit TssM [Stigmatella ashevillena]MDC0711165.1 type VI secretion system membrane subunit TssM [Stigmatella ashevillena]
MKAALLIAVLVALGWGAVFKLGLPPWTGLVLTGLGAVFLAVRIWIRRRRARKAAAKKIEEDITAQADEQARTVRPDLQPEIQAMKAEFSRAVASLKTSKLARGGRDALAVLPWYLIIGPPGTGKSTALRNSGLKFPYLSSRGSGGVRGVGGTRNCDWWLTNEAVFLDSAGRYTTGDEDREEWFAFLDILGRNRPSRPINGLIVTVSVSDLMGTDPQAAGTLGQRIRERVDEVTTRLKVVVPIYVMVTKCDLLPGFVEMFADLPRSERGQIWGFTAPLSTQQEAPSELLLSRFDELTSVLEHRSIRRIGQERRLETRERIHQFPLRFDALRKSLTEFIQPLFMESVFQDTPVMRGLYFTSGTQDVRIAERQVTGGASEVFGVNRAPAETVEGRSFFLWDVFNKVMFQDQKLAVRSSMEELRLRKQRFTLAVACMATAALVLVLPLVSYFQNLMMVRSIRDTIVSVKLEENDDIRRVEELTPLQQQIKRLHHYQVDGEPFWLRMGMYQGNNLFPLAQTFYNDQLKGILLGRQHGRIKQSLKLFAENQDRPDWKPSSELYGRNMDDLKMYLLITYPRSPREPELDAAHQSWLVWQIVGHWRGIRGTDRDVLLEETIARHAETYIEMLAVDPRRLGFVRDDGLVRGTRRALNRVPLATLHLEQLMAEASREYPDLTLSDIVGAVPEMRAARKVRGAFTRRAWEEMLRRQLDEAFQDTQAWVLNRDSKEDQADLQAELRTRYYQKYIEEWTEFLFSIRIEEPHDIDQTERMLTSLTRGKPPPFGKLFRAVAHNVQLSTPKEAGGKDIKALIERTLKGDSTQERDSNRLINLRDGKGETELMPEDVANSFGGLVRFATKTQSTEDKEEQVTQLDYYQDQLTLVLNTILDVKEKPAESGLLMERTKSVRKDVELLIGSQEGNQALFARLLLPPIRDVKIIVTEGVSRTKSNLWCSEVTRHFMGVMGRRYPFVKDSLEDAPLAELAEFLRPSNGLVSRFIQNQLKEDLLANGRRWQLAPSSVSMYRDDLPIYLERLNALSTALFPGDEVQPLVRFQIKVRAGTSPGSDSSDIASVKFTLDGTEVLYRNGPDNVWQRLIWPGQAGELGASLQVINSKGHMSEISQPGEWGLFRLLERVKKIEPSPDGRFFTATWEIEEFNGAQVSVDIRPERLAHPFFGASGSQSMKLMQLFRDPRVLPPQGIARNLKGCPEAEMLGSRMP